MTISTWLESSLTPQECDEILVQLLEISHSEWSTTFRLCDHNTDIVHGGNTYTAWAFQIPLVTEGKGLPKPTLIIDNINSMIAAAVKQIAGSSERPKVVHKLVTYSHPDYIERGPTTYYVNQITANIFQLAASLTLLAVDFDMIPFKKIDPGTCPGAFGVIR